MLKYERTIDLNGKWEFVPGYLKCENIYNYIFDCPHTGWQEIDVPYFWNGSRWMRGCRRPSWKSSYAFTERDSSIAASAS